MATADALPRQPETASIDARVVKALSHPTRVRILSMLRDRDLISPVQLAGELGLALGTVGYHVRRLEALGFIELAKRTQRRGAVEHHYRIRSMLDLPQSLPEHPGTDEPQPQGAGATAIAQEAQAAVARGGFDAVAAGSDLRVVTLDAQGRKQLRAAAKGWAQAIERVKQASARRLAANGGDAGGHACVAVAMAFDVVDAVVSAATSAGG